MFFLKSVFFLFISTINTTISIKNIAIIGASGNIGSELSLFLYKKGFNITAYDENPQIVLFPLTIIKKNSQFITYDELQFYDTVVFLGGCTGRLECAALSSKQRYKRNVLDVLDLVYKMNTKQHLITASTSAVLEGKTNAKETDTISYYLLDKYTMTMYKRELYLKYKINKKTSPRISILRFGTVVGVSIGQRTDLSIPQFFYSAYHNKQIHVYNPLSYRSYLWLNDLNRVIESMLIFPYDKKKISTFNIWNIASFHTTVLKVANYIGKLSNVSVHINNNNNNNNIGFYVNCLSFINTFQFTFYGNLSHVLYEFNKHIPNSIIPKGVHYKHENTEQYIIPCPVCGSSQQKTVLDLGNHPFANSFYTNSTISLNLPRYPIKLIWCKKCHHFHLSYIANRDDLFVHYLYQSGTSTTLNTYFKWLSYKIQNETGVKKGNVFEIGCNDGTQLDHFKNLEWNTYGIDPAINLVSYALKKGHIVKTGFWGNSSLLFPELPIKNNLHAIVVQNVLAHVPDPVMFLKACVSIMSKRTLLYIQTSQCNMHEYGQFDTAYHEHISFFTAHSFLKVAILSGLHIRSFETTPIHGTSCLVTMTIAKENDTSLFHRIEYEKKIGITKDTFYTLFSNRSYKIKEWMLKTIQELQDKKYIIGAYGAAAKGMTLLHFLLNSYNNTLPLFQFVLDDAILKQNTYCPGTSIPVYPVHYITHIENNKPIALVILAWNFWDEIEQRLKKIVTTEKNIIVLLPFPTPHKKIITV